MKRRQKIIIGVLILVFLALASITWYLARSTWAVPLENDTPPYMMPDYPVRTMVCRQSDNSGYFAYRCKEVGYAWEC